MAMLTGSFLMEKLNRSDNIELNRSTPTVALLITLALTLVHN